MLAGWGLLVLAGAIAWAAMKCHTRRAYWLGFGLAVVAGALFGISTWLVGIAMWIGQIPFLALAVVVVGGISIYLDLRDKQPDRAAVLFAMMMPLFIAPAVIDLPNALALIGNGFANLGDHLNTATKAR